MKSHPPTSPSPAPAGAFHLLEVTIISAQDLHKSTTHPYATAWVNPDHKLRTRVDPAGFKDPTWNDRFIFRIDDAFINSETSAIDVEIWAARRSRKDILLGTVRINVSSALTTRFTALLVRRPKTLRPQGILNVGVAVLDPCVTSVPMMNSAMGYAAWAHKDLIEDPGLVQVSPGPSEEGEKKVALKKCGSDKIGGWVVEEEMKALESKLEKWRIELPPASADRSGGRRRRSLACCFGGSNVRD